VSSDRDHVELIHDLLIPMRDGVRLAGNLYRPSDAGRWPCIVTYLPYHKDGRGGRGVYEVVHRHFASRGYAVLVVDFRGLGCSEGVNVTPFDHQEGRDGHDIVEWAATQPWCNGVVGMWGSSYGGITSLKTAAQQPPHLKAIVPLNATHDNYTDFLLLGGCPNGFWSNGDWGSRMVGYNLVPPLAHDPDGRLERLWLDRLQKSRPWPLAWYDEAPEIWAERAIPVERITAATLAVCGWHDFYAQGTIDYFNRLTCPKKLLMGPWKHGLPDLALVEPVHFVAMMDRWWDHWLKGRDTEDMKTPPITLFVQGSGVWRHESAWPPARNDVRQLSLHPAGELLVASPTLPANQRLAQYRYDPTVGLDSIGLDAWTGAVRDPGYHNGDDGRSLTFTTPPLADDWDLSGQARVTLSGTTSSPGLHFVAKLCDVSPDGRSRLVTMGWLPGPTAATSLAELAIALRSTAHVFRAGHRIRLAIALADFPRIWPTPHATSTVLQVDCSRSSLFLPSTPPRPDLTIDVERPSLPLKSPAELATSMAWHVGRELVKGVASLRCDNLVQYRLYDGGSITMRHQYTASVPEANAAEAVIDSVTENLVERPKGLVRVEARGRYTPTSAEIHADVTRDHKNILSRTWHSGEQRR
jgi:putative CocE/NonD family hydrolase